LARSAAFIVVHYRGTDLLKRAVEAILAECAGSGLDGDIVVVDNGSNDAQKAVLRSLPVRCLEGESNGGYAAALNIGIANTVAPYVFLMNPDVFVLPGCADALIAALDEGAAAAGPKTYWDEQKEFLLLPIERRMLADELAAAAAERSDRLAAWARRRWRKHAHRTGSRRSRSVQRT
jgi:GT2 family glycosyltransferase